MDFKSILLSLGPLGLLAQPGCSASGAPDETEPTASQGPTTGAGHPSTGSSGGGGFINLAPPLQEPLDPNQGTYSEAIPPDCAECFQADGGGLAPGLAAFLLKKHPTSRVGLISSMQDEVIRLFFAAGLNNCANNDPVTLLVLGMYPGPQFEQGLMDVRARYFGAPIATCYLGGANLTLHQHIWRDRFYTPAAGRITIADWTRDFIAGHLSHVGP